MEFRDFFDVNDLFSPPVFYTGDILFGMAGPDGLVLNAKQENGENSYLKFLERYYYKPIISYIGSDSIARIYPVSIEVGLNAEEKRIATFSLFKFVHSVFSGFSKDSDSMQKLLTITSNYTTDDLVTLLREELKLERKKHSDVKVNGKKSKYYDSMFELYTEFGYDGTFENFLEILINSKTKLIVGTRYFSDFFSRKIKTDELIDCYDYDKFCLLAARQVLDYALVVESGEGAVHNSIQFVNEYLSRVEEFRKHNPSYNCSIVSNDPNTGKRKAYTIEDIQREYNLLMARHPEHHFVTLTHERVIELLKTFGYDADFIESFDISTTDIKELTKVLKAVNESKSLLASWKIIPKGKREDTESFAEPIIRPSASLEENEAIRRMLISKNFFESSNYLFRIEGINHFEGYIGYIYPNGKAVFEKHYEDVEKGVVARSCATYIMGIKDLVEVSKLSKTQIIKGIRSGELKGIKRPYHRADMDAWCSDVSKAISGDDYSEQIVDYIDGLVDSEVVTKRSDKK